MNRRRFLGTAGAALAAAQALTAAAEPKGRPNVLWLISEDTSPDMACYGTSQVGTPNFDRLASEGIRYTQAYCTAPVCSAVRSGFMTGMYQTSIGAQNHRSHRGDGYRLPEPVQPITEYFRAAGYYICNAAGLNSDRPGKTDWNFEPARKPFDGADWSGRKPGQPFFAQINFKLTHRTFQRDKKRPIDPASVDVPPYYPDCPLTRRDWADYLESLQVLDGEIGTVLDRLDQEGLTDNTIVFYFGDHGRPHVRGKQWLYQGGIHVPLLVRWPGHIEPGVSDDLVSSVDYAPTSMSLAGLTPPAHWQGQAFAGPHAVKRDVVFAARDRCDETVDRIRCVCTGRYKYIRNFYPERPYTQFNAYKKKQYPVLTLMQVMHKRGELTEAQARFMADTRPEEELYDLESDPHEIHNLAKDAAHQKTLERLRATLDEWMTSTDDQGRFPEPAEETDKWLEDAQRRFARDMEKRGLSADVSDEDYLAWWERTLLET